MKSQPGYAASLALVTVLFGGCANFSEDRGFGLTRQTARDRLGKDAAWVRSEADADSVKAKVQALLANPHSADDAVPQPDTRIVYDAAASADKTHRVIRGATHYYQDQPGLLDEAVNALVGWLAERGLTTIA